MWEHPRVYSFEALTPISATLAADMVAESEVDTTECQCRTRCLADVNCRGYGFSDVESKCLLAKVLPTVDKLTERTQDPWQWHARHGIRRLGEPCSTSADCSLVSPGADCVNGTCDCPFPLERSEDGLCRKSGRFIEVGAGRLTSGLFAETRGTSIDTCEATCAENLTCIAFDFSPAEGLCSLYTDGVTADTGSGRDARSFVWSFPRPDGVPPDSYERVNDKFLSYKLEVTAFGGARVCFSDNAILFPGSTTEELSSAKEFLSTLPGLIQIGLEDMVEDRRFVRSDGVDGADVAWAPDEPNGHHTENCAALVGGNTLVNDFVCDYNAGVLCQYVGENLALGKRSWLNHPSSSAGTSPSHGNDNDTSTTVHVPGEFAAASWTVDLGDTFQVTAVLIVARDDCCGERNRLTELRVGSDRAWFDERRSARCVWLERQFVVQGYARLFRCTVPLTGRYVRLVRHKEEPGLDFAELAVFGNRLLKI